MTREEILLEKLDIILLEIKVDAGFARGVVRELLSITSEITNEQPNNSQ